MRDAEPPGGSPFAGRQQAREAALQMLYALEIGGQSREQVEHWYHHEPRLGLTAQSYARHLLGHTLERQIELDALLASHLLSWRPERLGAIDRCLLRLAAQELTGEEWIPAGAVIDEYLHLAKKFSQPQAASLVHGVLHAIARARRQPLTTEPVAPPRHGR